MVALLSSILFAVNRLCTALLHTDQDILHCREFQCANECAADLTVKSKYTHFRAYDPVKRTPTPAASEGSEAVAKDAAASAASEPKA